MKKVLSIIGNVLIWAFVALAAVVTVLAFSSMNNRDGLPNLLGRAPISVLSDSMAPTFNKGDLLINKTLTRAERAELQPDDIITFYTDLNGDGEQELNTHRIVSRRESEGYVFYTTRGDNTQTNTRNDDKEVRYDQVVAQYTGTRLPGIGSALSFLQTPTGFMVCVVVPLILFFLYEIYRFVTVVVSLRAQKEGVSAQTEEEIKRKAIEEYLAQQKPQEKSETTEDPQDSDPPAKE